MLVESINIEAHPGFQGVDTRGVIWGVNSAPRRITATDRSDPRDARR
jgi:hypothetical protein